MKTESNKHAIFILFLLVATAVLLFLLEKKFLIRESRGSTLSQYAEVDNILLLVEDFEGLSRPDSAGTHDSVFTKNAFYTFGAAKMAIDHSSVDKHPTASKSALMIEWKGPENYGGWGKGVGVNIKLDPLTDHINFRMLFPESHGKEEKIKIMLAEDDNENSLLEDQDDVWYCPITLPTKNEWQTVSVSLRNFIDENKGGDGILNVTRRGGIHTLTFVLDQPDTYVQGQKWYLDFINISDEMIPAGSIIR